jgi:hypothetical protein
MITLHYDIITHYAIDITITDIIILLAIITPLTLLLSITINNAITLTLLTHYYIDITLAITIIDTIITIHYYITTLLHY